ncbi:hypothetical protein C8A00DRAFT_34653 [Chaetomidium leptoderma]|uniref:Uncharacterized protein n=1 Tax=Chaetomidium leptoderma TaxID=669021 RepID=A0AAN6VJX1_9PEZI|nr:hypothetical protein C8A00DRAFT_34653 [Chaetomidium leptoderma]
MGGKQVAGWSDEEIVEAVKEEVGKDLTQEERSKLKFQMEKSSDGVFVAVVVDFDGADGLIIVNEVLLTTGEEDGDRL